MQDAREIDVVGSSLLLPHDLMSGYCELRQSEVAQIGFHATVTCLERF